MREGVRSLLDVHGCPEHDTGGLLIVLELIQLSVSQIHVHRKLLVGSCQSAPPRYPITVIDSPDRRSICMYISLPEPLEEDRM